MTSKEIICKIDENFYKIVDIPQKMVKLARSLIEALCQENDVPIAKLVFKRLQPFVYGDYYFKTGTIKTNSFLYQNFGTFRQQNNFFYVFRFFEGLLHECRHHIQFKSETLEDFQPIVKGCAKLAKMNKGAKLLYDSSYYMVPIEIDARHYAHACLSNNPLMAKYLKSEFYIENEIENADQQYDYNALIKNTSEIFKPALKEIKKALSAIKVDDKSIDRNMAIYHEIAPNFKNMISSTLTKEENDLIDQQQEEFNTVVWKDMVAYFERKRKLKGLNSQYVHEK